jgi:hypothetical protein
VRPLCENIFDVQRGELFEVLERLRLAFWSDQVIETSPPPPPTIAPVQIELPNLKRVRSEPDEDLTYQQESISTPPAISKKRVRLDNIPGKTSILLLLSHYSQLLRRNKSNYTHIHIDINIGSRIELYTIQVTLAT